jgi:hypothetical protein
MNDENKSKAISIINKGINDAIYYQFSQSNTGSDQVNLMRGRKSSVL